MKATLTIIRNTPAGPAAILSLGEEATREQVFAIKEQIDEWFTTQGGVFVLGGVDLTVTQIDLDLSGGTVTVLTHQP